MKHSSTRPPSAMNDHNRPIAELTEADTGMEPDGR